VDPTVQGLLVILLLIAGQSLWFGLVKPVAPLAWLQQTSFVITTFILIPLVVFVLYSQATATDRLEKIGIEAHPAIKHADGIGNGWGEHPIWVFSLEADAADVLDYYFRALADTQWQILENNGLYLRYRKQDQILMIAHKRRPGHNTLVISVTNES
jgi:hypothetical protein